MVIQVSQSVGNGNYMATVCSLGNDNNTDTMRSVGNGNNSATVCSVGNSNSISLIFMLATRFALIWIQGSQRNPRKPTESKAADGI